MMKRAFLILTLLVAINFSTPVGSAYALTTRHGIEYVSEEKSKDLTEKEMLKNKVVMFLRLQMLIACISRVENSYSWYLNSG